MGDVWAIEKDSSNNLYIGGNFPDLYKLGSNGIQDTSLDVGSAFDAPVTSIKINANGKIMVGGFFTQYKSEDCNPGIVRLEANGDLDTSFAMTGVGLYRSNEGYYDTVSSVDIQSDGKIVVGGYFCNYNSGTVEIPVWSKAKGIIRFNSNGSIDSTFATGTGFDGYVNDLIISSGNIFCVGSFFNYNRRNCTSQFNIMNSEIAGCCAKLSNTGILLGTSMAQDIQPIGMDDGGNDLWDGGFYLNTNLTGSYNSINEEDSIPNTHSVFSPALNDYDATYDMMVSEVSDVNGFDAMNYDFPVKDGEIKSATDYFGSGSTYFTQMYPGLFVLGANNINITEFSITGGLGSDGDGISNHGSFELVVNGIQYAVFYKDIYDTGDPSLVKMIIVLGSTSGITQDTYDELESDDQVLTGLEGRKELYVLTFARFDELQTSEELMTSIATEFLSLFASPEVIRTCSTKMCDTPAFKCYVGTISSCTCSTWKYFYPNCTKTQQALGICNGLAGAYVPAIIVCNQRLF